MSHAFCAASAHSSRTGKRLPFSPCRNGSGNDPTTARTSRPPRVRAATLSRAAIPRLRRLPDDEHDTVAASAPCVVAVVGLVDRVDVDHITTGRKPPGQQVAPGAVAPDLEPGAVVG